MKPGIHPDYHAVTVHCACGHTFPDPLHGEERVAVGAKFRRGSNVALNGGAGRESMTASTMHGDGVIVG